MNSVDESITHCLEEVDNNFVKAIDIVSSMNRSIKVISSNMKELEQHSQTWFSLFNFCEMPPKDTLNRESINTLVLTDDENVIGLMRPIDSEEVPSFLQEGESESYLKYMSPPRTTKVYKPLNTPGGENDSSAMDTSSSYFGISPPQTPLLKRRKAHDEYSIDDKTTYSSLFL